MEPIFYTAALRNRITELRLQKDVSERQMSLDIGKSESYMGHISNGVSLPSVTELLNIISYFEMTPAEFFLPLTDRNLPLMQACEKLRKLDEKDIEIVTSVIERILTLYDEAEHKKCGINENRK